MQKIITMFMSMNDLSLFSVIAEKQPFDVDVRYGRYIANGKSLLNLISLNLLKSKIEVVIHGEPEQNKKFIEGLRNKGFELWLDQENMAECYK